MTVKVVNCKNCNISVDITRNSRKIFCNHSCAAFFNNKLRIKKIKTCALCLKKLQNFSSVFCSINCFRKNEFLKFISKWKNGEISGNAYSGPCSQVKRYIKEKYHNKCARCGWCEINPVTNKSPLQIDHIDGNYKNNQEENLILLCPNCHSLTPTYGALNKGNGRPYRYSK